MATKKVRRPGARNPGARFNYRKASSVKTAERKRIKASDMCVHEMVEKFNLPLEAIVAIRCGEPVPRGL